LSHASSHRQKHIQGCGKLLLLAPQEQQDALYGQQGLGEGLCAEGEGVNWVLNS